MDETQERVKDPLSQRFCAVREQLPVTERYAYLNTGTAGPLPRRAVAAIAHWNERQALEGRADFTLYLQEYWPLLDDLRAHFAKLLGANADEIALTHHTTEGLNIVAWGLNWRPGDEIVTTSLEHEGGLLPVYAVVRRFGLTLRIVDGGTYATKDEWADKIAAALSPRTRLVMVSHVSYQTGTVLPVQGIVEAAHRVGALVAVDGAQSAGAIPINVHEMNVDFYAVPGQKWLCGPEGVGALYVRRERLSELAPTFVGFASLRLLTDGAFAPVIDLSGYFIPAPDARRYEVGTVYWPALFGMRESLRWLEELGYDWIYHQTQVITRRCRERLAELPGLALHSPDEHAGLTSFSLPGVHAQVAVKVLAERGVIIRTLPYRTGTAALCPNSGTVPQHWLRVSTGFFNSEDDLARLCDGLRTLQ